MRLYVAIGWFSYEGNDDPIGVFSTKKLAEKALAEEYQEYDGIEIQQFNLDRAGKLKTIDVNRAELRAGRRKE